MTIQEFIPLGSKTTMRIGGKARYYADLMIKEDVENAFRFATEKGIPLIPLGGGSNTIFADDVIEALVVRIKADAVIFVEAKRFASTKISVQSGKILASLINELAAENLDLSALTGIPGTVGGAIFGNAGQGPGGVWIDRYVESVTAFVCNSGQWTVDSGQWKTLTRGECNFQYRESGFKNLETKNYKLKTYPIIWEATLNIPSRPATEIKAKIERLIKKRIETQPHLKTAGSCFKATSDGTPAWKLIDAAGLRGLKIGDIQVAEKHANFLLNVGKGTFIDAVTIVKKIREKVPEIAGIEMRFYSSNGQVVL